MNSLTRDQILTRALDMVDSPTLNEHDRPSGTIVATAFSISWLQDGINTFYEAFPWEAPITSAAITVPGGQAPLATVNAPSDFIADFRNGIVLGTPLFRLARKSMQEVINQAYISPDAGTPSIYSVHKMKLYVQPAPASNTNATLWYYQLPATLGPSGVPTFPTDLLLIEYVRLRGLEWIRALQPGSALVFVHEQVRLLREAGLGREPESTELMNDPLRPRKQAGDEKLFTKTAPVVVQPR